MPNFEIVIRRTQIQHVNFIVEAKSQDDLEEKLDQIDDINGFADIDGRFDEGEVDSIEYEVTLIKKKKKNTPSLSDDDLQDMLDNL